jgi:hypothetical protein
MDHKIPAKRVILARSVLGTAVGNGPLAIDNSRQYRPQESPANGHIEDDAVDAVGTLRRLLKTSASYRGWLTDQGLSEPP